MVTRISFFPAPYSCWYVLGKNKQLHQCEGPVIAPNIKCRTEVKYDSTMSWRAYEVSSFRQCQVAGGRLLVTPCWGSTPAAPLSPHRALQMESLCRMQGGHSNVWNPRSCLSRMSASLYLTPPLDAFLDSPWTQSLLILTKRSINDIIDRCHSGSEAIRWPVVATGRWVMRIIKEESGAVL